MITYAHCYTLPVPIESRAVEILKQKNKAFQPFINLFFNFVFS